MYSVPIRKVIFHFFEFVSGYQANKSNNRVIVYSSPFDKIYSIDSQVLVLLECLYDLSNKISSRFSNSYYYLKDFLHANQLSA